MSITLTSRERLTRLFNGQDIDRVPIWLLAPYHKYGAYVDIYNIPCYKPITEYIEKYCDTLDRRSFDNGFCYNMHPDIIRENMIEEKNGNSINKDILSYKDITFTKSVSRGISGTKVKYFIDDIDDLDKILSLPYQAPEANFDKYNLEKAELGDKGLMMLSLGDPLCPLYSLSSAEDFSMWTLTDYDKIIKFTDVMYRRVYDYYKYFLERNIGEVFFIVGAEFAGPPLVSPSKFNEMVVRYVKGIVDLIRSYGKKSIVHYHGNLYKVLDGMKGINPDGLHTIEAPPIGDCTITQAREALGDMILIGNIQYDDLIRGNKDDITELVRQAIEDSKGGRFILSPTAGPYENYLNDKTVENYKTFVDAGIKFGKL